MDIREVPAPQSSGGILVTCSLGSGAVSQLALDRPGPAFSLDVGEQFESVAGFLGLAMQSGHGASLPAGSARVPLRPNFYPEITGNCLQISFRVFAMPSVNFFVTRATQWNKIMQSLISQAVVRPVMKILRTVYFAAAITILWHTGRPVSRPGFLPFR